LRKFTGFKLLKKVRNNTAFKQKVETKKKKITRSGLGHTRPESTTAKKVGNQ